MSDLFIPVFISFIMLYALIKNVDAYSSFVNGAKGSLSLMATLMPYIVAMFIAVELFKCSGVSGFLSKILSPIFSLFGIPSELCELMLIRPFSSNAAYVVLKDIFTQYGVDTYIGRCASVIVGSSDTIFYVSSIYFASTNTKRTGLAIPIALVCNVVGAIVACLCCRIM